MPHVPAVGAKYPLAAVFRFCAVLAAAGPVILMALGVGGRAIALLCHETVSGPYALESVTWELLFWAELLLPVVLAGLLLWGPRRLTVAAVSAIGAVLAFGLFTAIVLPGTDPGTDPCTGQALPVVLGGRRGVGLRG